jgi:hypothetical protein
VVGFFQPVEVSCDDVFRLIEEEAIGEEAEPFFMGWEDSLLNAFGVVDAV